MFSNAKEPSDFAFQHVNPKDVSSPIMTTTEIEAKMRLHDVPALRARLASLGAQPLGGHHEINTFFDTAGGTLRASDHGLRVRVEQPEGGEAARVVITHKGPRSHGPLKTRPETELRVADAQAAADLLHALGFVTVLSFEKRRQRFRFEGCMVDIDELPHLGCFVEIEGPSDKVVLSVRKKLALDHLPLVQASYIALLTTYLRENKIAVEHVALPRETVS